MDDHGRKMTGRFLFLGVLCLAALCLCLATPALKAQAKTINVKKYGAKAGTDSTEAIQKALDEAAKTGTAKKPTVVKIPKGTFLINKTLYIGSNTTLKLTKKTVIKKTEKFGLLNMLSTRPGTKGGYDDSSNITVNGGVWDGEFKLFTSTSGGSIFFFAHATNVKITGAEIRNNFGTHLVELGGVKDCTISDCKLHGFKAKGKDVEKEAIQLDITHDENILPHGEPFDDTPCRNLTVRNCEIYDYPRAIGSHMAVEGIVHIGLNVENCDLHDLKAAAVYTFATEEVKVSGCTIKNAQIGISFRTGTIGDSSIILKRNKGVAAMNVTPGGNVFSGNTITSIADEGIAVYGTTASTSGNTIENTGKNAVTVSYGSELEMDGDDIRSTKAIGVSVTNDSGVSMKNVRISDSAKIGLYVGPGCKASAEGGEIKNAGSHGINAVSS
ncbi:MAG: right-handed parallel beta-helix repeat-containing protein, partial [Lachnospiraceae bacterium]|nr:right-handed parallel beta-helix repeat-containing protein [Lachnospiraceae bacterium]